MTANFTIINGQVYTPGLAIIDAPQPYTPLGGGIISSTDLSKWVRELTETDTLQVAIDVSGDGHLPWPPTSNSPTALQNITLFLTSYAKSHNFTISNGTAPDNLTNAYVGPIFDLEPSSTVKHVNWHWPACFVGQGSSESNSARGDYNISIHQAFRWNETEYYTVFDLPISVSNGIDNSAGRVDCSVLENMMLSPETVAKSSDSLPGQPWIGNGTSTEVKTGSGTCLRPGKRGLILFGLAMLLLNGA